MQRPALCICLFVLAACSKSASESELMSLAQQALDKREFNVAVIHLKGALSQNPDLAEARVELAKVLLRMGDAPGALIELRKAQEARAPIEQVLPELARAMVAVGDGAKLIEQYAATTLPTPGATADLKATLAGAYAQLGQTDKAREAAVAAMQAQPGHGAATVVLAQLDVSAGDVDGALRKLDELLAREAANERAGLLKGELLLRARKDPEAALASLRQLRVANPQSLATPLAMLNILSRQGKNQEARSEFEAMRKIGPRHPETLFWQAQFAFDDKDYKGCREMTELLLARSPNELRLLMLGAAAEFEMRQYTLAQGLLGRALKVAPDQALARQMLAQTFLRTALPDKAIEVLQPLLAAAKPDASSLALAGEAWMQAGDAKRAEASFQQALKAAPDDAELRASAAMVQLARGDVMPAIAKLEALAKGDGGTRVEMALLSARLRQNDFKAALQVVDTMVRKQPEQALPLTLRGRVLALMGDMAGAAASFEASLAKEPNYLGAIAGLAAIELTSGKPEQARKRLDDLVKADPKQMQARLTLAELDIRLGAPDSAVVAQLKEAVKIDAGQAAPHLLLIDRLLASGDAKGAQVAAQDASAALPTDFAVMDALGRAQVAAGDVQRAVSTFRRLADLQPKKALPQVRLADAFMTSGNRSSAAVALRAALTIEPNDLQAPRLLALLAATDKRPQEGLAIARSLQQRLPKDKAGFALEGELHAGMKQWAGAATAYAAALQRGKSSALAMQLHHVLREDGKAAEADRLAADWLKASPGDAAFLYYLGDRAVAAKDWPRAEAQYRAVVALQPRHAMALNNIAWLMATQREPGAVAMAERAGALLPDRPALLDTFALALDSENQLPKAIEVQRRAVSLDAKDPKLRLGLARLLIKAGDKSAAREELQGLAALGERFSGQAEVSALMKGL